MTELSFLIDLLLNEKLSKPVKDKIAGRIREIEATPREWTAQPAGMRPHPMNPAAIPAHLAGQSASTIANFMKHNPTAVDVTPQPPAAQIETPADPNEAPAQPAAVVASPQAAHAMAARQAAINLAISGKPAPGEKGPRKFRNL